MIASGAPNKAKTTQAIRPWTVTLIVNIKSLQIVKLTGTTLP